ncbi:hypothetical protein SBBP2_320023 [Burkholderiales bacterium]|nr:hypothetical protein SBBP2_320023 [Burkholderiales bacterium]
MATRREFRGCPSWIGFRIVVARGGAGRIRPRQMPFQVSNAIAQFHQVAYQRGVAFPVTVAHHRENAGVEVGFGQTAGDQGPGADDRTVRNAEMPMNHGGTAQLAVAADDRAAGDSNASGNGRMRADVAIVSDLHLIVDLYPVADDRIAGGAAIDRRIGANFHVVANLHDSGLRNLDPTAVERGKPKAVGADDGAGMDNAAPPDAASVVHAHPGIQSRTIAHPRPGAKHAAGPDPCASLDDRGVLDHHLIVHPCARINPRAGGDHRAARTPGNEGVAWGQNLGGKRKPGIRGITYDQGTLRSAVRKKFLAVRAGQHQGSGGGVHGLLAIARIGEERQVPRLCGFETGSPLDRQRAITDQLCRQLPPGQVRDRLEQVGYGARRGHRLTSCRRASSIPCP